MGAGNLTFKPGKCHGKSLRYRSQNRGFETVNDNILSGGKRFAPVQAGCF